MISRRFTSRAYFMALRLLVAVALTVTAKTAAAKTFTVNDVRDLPDAVLGDGICRTSATDGGKCTLRAAVDETELLAGADTIKVKAGYYLITEGCLVVTESLNIVGAGASSTILDGTNKDRVLDVNAADSSVVVSVSGLTFFHGDPGYNRTGGAILNEGGGTLRAVNCFFTGNTARCGGALYNEEGCIMEISSCRIEDNTAQSYDTMSGGGGIVNKGILKISATFIARNRVIAPAGRDAWGGGIYNDSAGQLSIKNSSIHGNLALALSDSARGGGIVSMGDGFSTTIKISGSKITGNQAKSLGAATENEIYGGGLFLRDTPFVTIAATKITGNSVFSLESTTARGGGIGADRSSAVNVTRSSSITNNISSADAFGGIYRQTPGNITISTSSVIKNNLPTNE